MSRLTGFVEKGWGHELIWATNDQYCGKLLKFTKGRQCSMHFHKDKEETWYVLDGQFQVVWIDTRDATEKTQLLNPGDIWHNEPLKPHRLICLEEGTVIEVSTADSIEDNYRIAKGHSQL